MLLFPPIRRVSVAALLAVAVIALALWPALAVAQSRIVAVGDIHGDFDAFTAILREAGVIDANRQWTGGNTTLVQVGDMLDRGLKEREVLDLLMALEQQAPQAGGRVVVLLGNHEVMNLMGDLRYTVNFTPFADAQSDDRRKAAYQAYINWRTQQAVALGQPPPALTPASEQRWMEEHLRGFVEREEAFRPDGTYGRWLRTKLAIVQIDSAIFLHGGIGPKFASMSVAMMNAQIKNELALFDRFKQDMVGQKLILPFFTLNEMTAVAQQRLRVLATKTGLTEQEKQSMNVLKDFLDNGKWLSMDADGPLWFRGLADWSDTELGLYLPTLRKAFGNARFVVGHTTQTDGRVHVRAGGKIVLIDTGMLSSYFRGRASALEIRGGTVTVIYVGQRTVLQEASATGLLKDAPAPKAGQAAGSDGGRLVTSQPARRVWLGPNGSPLPFSTDQQILEFLTTARVVSMKEIGDGVTKPKKVLLEKDGVQMHAIFRDVHVERDSSAIGKTAQRFLRDDCIFECAAYTLGRMLGIDTIPPVVRRTIDGRDGSLQIWVEQSITEKARRKLQISPADQRRWDRQWQVLWVFDNLVYNDDPNLGNALIDQQWTLWLIDHTRAFQSYPELPYPKRITQCERNLWQRLQTLDEAAVRQQLSPYLRPAEVDALLTRRRQLVEFIQSLIKARGEQVVLFAWE